MQLHASEHAQVYTQTKDTNTHIHTYTHTHTHTHTNIRGTEVIDAVFEEVQMVCVLNSAPCRELHSQICTR